MKSGHQKKTKPWYSPIKEFDVFGENIIFTLNQKTELKTSVGLFATLILCGIAAFMFVFMGQSFFFMTDPQTTFSFSKYDTVPTYNTENNRKMFVAFRLRSFTGQTISNDELIYSIVATKNTPNQVTASQRMALTKCEDNMALDLNYIRDRNLNDFVCLPLNNENFGGSISDKNYTYYSVNIDFCNPLFPECKTNVIRANYESTSSMIYPEFAYPEVFFDPYNKTDPLSVKHVVQTDTYLAFTYNQRSIYFKNSTIKDDQGWMLQEYNEKSFLSASEFTNKGIYKTSINNAAIAKYSLYIGSVKEVYTRKYQKIQDVIAIVGGFIRICQVALKILLTSYVKYLRNIEIMNGIINFKDDEEKIKVPSGYYDKASTDTRFKRMFRYVCNEVNNLNKTGDDKGESKLEESNMLEISDNTLMKLEERHKLGLNSQSRSKAKSEVSMREREMSSFKKLSIVDLKNEISFRKKKKFIFSLTFGTFVKKLLCYSTLANQQAKHVKLYELAEEYFKDRLDVLGYLSFINEMNKVKSIIFNNIQGSALNFVENPVIYVNNPNLDASNVSNMKFLLPKRQNELSEVEMKRITQYFSRKIFEKKLTTSDKQILMSLDEEVLREIALQNIINIEKMIANKNINFVNEVNEQEPDNILDF